MSKYQYKVQGVDYDVDIVEVEGNIAKVTVNDVEFEVEMKTPISLGHQMPKPVAVKPVAAPVQGTAPAPAQPAPAPVQAGAGAQVKAPLPGTIKDIPVKVGDAVAVGDTVCVLEAMKMLNNIEAENAGTITSICVNKGDTVMEGAVLVTIA